MLQLLNIKYYKKRLAVWTSLHFLNLSMFNLMIVVLVLLHSAGYFDPYWTISINTIVFISLLSSIFLFKAGSRVMFIGGIIFWLFAGLIRVLGVNVWAERVAIYVFEAIFLGVVLLIIESFNFRE